MGQSEVEVAGTADTTVVLLAPGMGDGIQAAKAGILEVADVLVVNKADREGADRTVRDLRHAVSMAVGSEPATWRAAGGAGGRSHGGRRSSDVVAAVEEHLSFLGTDGVRARRARRAASEIEGLALDALRARVGGLPATSNSTRWPPRSSPAAWTRMPRPTASSSRSPERRLVGQVAAVDMSVEADHWQGWPPPDGSGLVGASGT